MLFRWRKIWEVCTKEERKREETMLAEARSADRHRQEENKQIKKMATGAIRKGCEYWGEETSSNWARKSSQKQKEVGLGTHTRPQKSPSPMTFLPSESKHAINYRAGHAHSG